MERYPSGKDRGKEAKTKKAPTLESSEAKGIDLKQTDNCSMYLSNPSINKTKTPSMGSQKKDSVGEPQHKRDDTAQSLQHISDFPDSVQDVKLLKDYGVNISDIPPENLSQNTYSEKKQNQFIGAPDPTTITDGTDEDDYGGDDDEDGPSSSSCSGQLQTAGNESTGRWTRQEHDLFLEALKKYGKVKTIMKSILLNIALLYGFYQYI